VTVLVDATSVPPNRGGVARYLAGLLQGLSEVGERAHVVVKDEDRDWMRSQAPGHDYLVAPAAVSLRPVRLLWEQVALPALLRRTGADVLHSPHYTFPLAVARRTVVTVHDATFFTAPQDHGRLKRAFFRAWIRAARRWAASTVVPSRATALEAETAVGPARHAVHVALHGVDRQVFARPEAPVVADFAARHGLDATGWIAFLGTVEPRKNVPVLLEAHRLLRARDPATPPLLLAGGLGWDETAGEALRAAGDVVGAPVRYLGYLPLHDLAPFLGGATVVVYPSSAEGFGLPVLEAMSTGAAVLTTPRTALPEVGGDAVAYAEPTVDATADALGRLLRSPDERARLGRAALERAATFSWSACADVHVGAWGAVT